MGDAEVPDRFIVVEPRQPIPELLQFLREKASSAKSKISNQNEECEFGASAA